MSEYCKVLIVDDEFLMRQGMKHMLEWEKEGFQIVGEASNGQEGLDLVEQLKPHIVLADIVMPVIDGIEFSEILEKKFPFIQLIILSSYDKFEYVKTTLLHGAADYILKPTLNPDILLKALLKAAEKIPNLTLNVKKEVPHTSQVEKMLLGYKEKLDEIIFANFFPNTLYRLLAIDLSDLCGSYKKDMFAIKQMTEEYYGNIKTYVSLPVFMEEGMLCIVLNYRVKDESAIILDSERIANKIHRLYQKSFFVVSRSFSNMQDMRFYYQHDIKNEIHNGFYHEGEYLYIIDTYEEKEKPKRFEFEQYTRLLIMGNYEEALLMFEEYIKYLCIKQIEEDKMKNLTKNLLYNYLMEIEKYNIDSEDLKEQYFKRIDNTFWLKEFKDTVEKIIEEIKCILSDSVGMEDIRIVEIKQYVAKHYKEPLELSDIAKQFNFNYNYLSSYFTQMTKEGFSEYLNKIRIKHACDLLKQRDMSISSVSGMVGYTDHSYFCRVFKKITGETPSGYRNRMKKDC